MVKLSADETREIEHRSEGVFELKEKKIERKQLRESLKGIQDIERLTSRIFLGHANARDLIGLKNSLKNLPVLKSHLQPFTASTIGEYTSEIENFDDLYQLLESSILD